MSESHVWTPESGLDVLLLLLYAPSLDTECCEPISGITRLDKLMFLLSKSDEFSSLFEDDYEFVPYNFGPFATELLDDLEALITEGLITRTKLSDSPDASSTRDAEIIEEELGEIPEEDVSWDMYSLDSYALTSDGKKIAEKLFTASSENQRSTISRIKSQFNSISLLALLRFVYKSYPSYAEESFIKDKVLQRGG